MYDKINLYLDKTGVFGTEVISSIYVSYIDRHKLVP